MYRDAATATYDGGSTLQGTVNMTAHFGSGSNGVFNIEDGIAVGTFSDRREASQTTFLLLKRHVR